jgi:RNA methyltransferase, TrmH family
MRSISAIKGGEISSPLTLPHGDEENTRDGTLRAMNLPAPITSRTNAKVKALRAALSGKASKVGDLLGLEGEHLIHDAHMWGHSFETVYLREGNEGFLDLPDLPVEGCARPAKAWCKELRTANWAVLSRDVFDSAVTTMTPQGIAATWVIRDPIRDRPDPPVGLIVEDLQDPGNLGTLIRSAAAFGAGDIMVTPGTVNHWNPKVVRSAMGAVFTEKVTKLPIEQIVERLHSEGVRIFAAVSGWLMGPEYGYPVKAARHGVLTGRLENQDAPIGLRYGVSIPDRDEALFDRHESRQPVYAASSSFDTDFVQPWAIMIGNEGAGLSQKARQLADEQVLIPCSVESLNAAVAGSVLMYEAMRQIPLRIWAKKQGLRK